MGRDDLTSWPSRQFIEVLMWKICPCPTKPQLAGPGLPKLFAAIILKLYQILTILPFPTPNLNLDRSSLPILLIYYPWSYFNFPWPSGLLYTSLRRIWSSRPAGNRKRKFYDFWMIKLSLLYWSTGESLITSTKTSLSAHSISPMSLSSRSQMVWMGSSQLGLTRRVRKLQVRK